MDPASGFFSTRTNIGEIENKGLEVDLGVEFFRSEEEGGFSWNANANFTTYKSEVIDLGLDTQQVVYSGFGNLGNAAIPGEPLGVIFGSQVLEDGNGNRVVDNARKLCSKPYRWYYWRS